MLPVIPVELFAASWEMIGCLLTSLAAIVSYVFVSGQ